MVMTDLFPFELDQFFTSVHDVHVAVSIKESDVPCRTNSTQAVSSFFVWYFLLENEIQIKIAFNTITTTTTKGKVLTLI